MKLKNVPEKAAMQSKQFVIALAALAHESRLAVFRLLVQAGPLGVVASKIAQELEIPASSLSFHLKELTRADLIVPKQDGRFIIYAANFGSMNALLSFLTDNCCGGNPCSPVSTSPDNQIDRTEINLPS
jgi:ArsR family transcriptional regulator, arsenate/arsenite/antimonite-responsive transcriptional repressor